MEQYVGIPLEEKVMKWAYDNPFFTHKDLAEIFPNEHWRRIYRAMNELEKAHRIRFTGTYKGKQRVFTTLEVSELPTILDAKGNSAVISQYVKNMAHLYANHPLTWNRLMELNEFPITVLRMFLIPQLEGKEQRQLYHQVVSELVKYRASLTSLLESVDRIIKHPTMSGDVDHFLSVFDGDDKELPSPIDMNNAKLWYNKNWTHEDE